MKNEKLDPCFFDVILSHFGNVLLFFFFFIVYIPSLLVVSFFLYPQTFSKYKLYSLLLFAVLVGGNYILLSNKQPRKQSGLMKNFLLTHVKIQCRWVFEHLILEKSERELFRGENFLQMIIQRYCLLPSDGVICLICKELPCSIISNGEIMGTTVHRALGLFSAIEYCTIIGENDVAVYAVRQKNNSHYIVEQQQQKKQGAKECAS